MTYEECNYIKTTVDRIKHSPFILNNGKGIYNYFENINWLAYDVFYKFQQLELFEISKNYNFYPAYLYFADNKKFNAFANSDSNIIGINMGVIEEIGDLFLQSDPFENNIKLKQRYEIIDKSLREHFRMRLNKLVFNYVTCFTYYHELAHLIQMSQLDRKTKRTIYNAYENINIPFHPLPHLMEIDADSYAANRVAELILKHSESLLPKISEGIVYNRMFTISIAAIFTCYLKFLNGFQELYFREKKHPHILIRITIIYRMIVACLRNNINSTIILDENKILIDSLLIANNISEAVSFKYMHMYERNLIDIHKFIKELTSEVKNYPFLTTNRMR